MHGRREFLRVAAGAALGVASGESVHADAERGPETEPRAIRLFVCGDVMLGRGIDQILPRPSAPELYEAYVRDARDYVRLAERASGAIPRSVPLDYVWGDALRELERRRPDVRIVNLETSVTVHDRPWPKGINYRMHPANAPCLPRAGIDCCVLANNHVIDWEREGLAETLATLRALNVAVAGAGADEEAASAPAILPVGARSRVLVFAAATDDSGVPDAWAATASRSGVNRLPDLSTSTLASIADRIRRVRREGDRVVFSLHWGGNWGYAIASAQRAFAHGLVEEAGVDLVYGHSSHHVKALEVHRDRAILYGCGDFLDDYEGIEGYEEFRADLGLMYFPVLDANGRLLELTMTPTRIRRFRIERAGDEERAWLAARLRRECARFGGTVDVRDDGTFALTRTS